jgi:hypothetical protein
MPSMRANSTAGAESSGRYSDCIRTPEVHLRFRGGAPRPKTGWRVSPDRLHPRRVGTHSGAGSNVAWGWLGDLPVLHCENGHSKKG